MKKLLIVDNYDSFTYNLVQLVQEHSGWKFELRKNNEIKLEEVKAFDKILLSPGPGLPEEAGMMLDLIREFSPTKSILGVCLGYHAIAKAFGASLFNFAQPIHGIKQKVSILQADLLFHNIPEDFEAGLYHSWAVSKENFPKELELIALSKRDVIMALRHCSYDVKGVQFHPESIMTPFGKQMLWNWLNY